MSWIEIMPKYEGLFPAPRWDSAEAFLAWSGTLVNRHRDRQVEQVVLGGGTEAYRAWASGLDHSFFIKKDFAVSWAARARNAWAGFGWCATAVREAATLQALRRAGVGCPEVVALGEAGRRAFVLMRDDSDMSELRTILPSLSDREQRILAMALGRELAHMHDAGFDHPDLFAKHILVAARGDGYRFSILDWQRSRRRRWVRWRIRVRDLAVLDATLHHTLASDRLRLHCLNAYRKAIKSANPPLLRRLALQIETEAARLFRRSAIREIGQRAIDSADQQFVALDEGGVLVVRSFREEMGERLATWLHNLRLDESPLASTTKLSATEDLTTWPTRSDNREFPDLAHTLFRLHRFGVPAPRLLAVGWSAGRVFVVTKSAVTVPFAEAFAAATHEAGQRLIRRARKIARRVREAGYVLPAGENWTPRLGVHPDTGKVSLVQVEPLVRDEAAWLELEDRVLATDSSQNGQLEREVIV